MQQMIDDVTARAAKARTTWDNHPVFGFREHFYDRIRTTIRELDA